MKALAALLLLATVVAAFGLAGLPALEQAGTPRWQPAQAQGGRLAVVGGLALLELSGTPAQRGAQAAALVGRQAADLLGVMRWNPNEPLAANARRAEVLAAVRDSDRAELAACAAAAGLDLDAMLRANATIETMCSAVAHVPSGMVARNMDFFPAGPLGQATVLQVVREPGRRTYAAVGWPAMAGVISGMNDAGLSACILLNFKGSDPPAGEPLAFRVRAILQDCADVEAGLAAMRAATVGSRHYVLLMDARSAAIAWWDAQGLHIDRPDADGWLVASNWIRDGSVPRRDDARGCSLVAARTALTAAPDPVWFRRVLTASYMVGLNAQAMVLAHRERRLELCLADGLAPAVLRGWFRVELGPLLDGAGVDRAQVTALPAETPMRHYTEE